MHERDRYLLEVLETTLKTVERVTRRMDKEAAEDRETLGFLLHELREIEHDLHPPTPPHPHPHPHPTFATSISFTEDSMNPTQAGNTQVFTGTLVPAGATYPADTTFTLTSNDPAVSPTVDSTGLVVSVTYPDGWVESTSTPLAFSYGAASVSENGAISATITPSAPVGGAFPSGISFQQSQ